MASLEVRKSCYWLSFYYQGRRYRTSLGGIRRREAELAERRAEGVLSLLEAGLAELPPDVSIVDYVLGRQQSAQEPQQEPNVATGERRLTIGDLMREYKVFAEPPSRAPSSYTTEMIHLKHFEGFLGDRLSGSVEDIDCRVFDEYKRLRAGRVRPDTVNKELQTLRQVFTLGVRYGYVGRNPLDDVEQFEETRPEHGFLTKEEIDEIRERSGNLTREELRELRRFRYLHPEEIGRLLELEAGTDLYPGLTIIAYTGIRRGELLQLEWQDVDLRRGKVTIKSRKGSQVKRYQVREIDLHPLVREVLAAQKEQEQKGRYVLTDEGGEPWKPWKAHDALKRIVRGTEFEGIGFHTLRHSFSSNLARAGVDDRTIDYFMGHQTEEMRRRYQHLFPQTKREAIGRLGY